MTAVGLFRCGAAWDDAFTLRDHPHAAEHRPHVRSLLRDGTLEAGRPLQPIDELLRCTLAGLAVFADDDLEAARALLVEDPAVQTGVLEVEVLPWLR